MRYELEEAVLDLVRDCYAVYDTRGRHVITIGGDAYRSLGKPGGERLRLLAQLVPSDNEDD